MMLVRFCTSGEVVECKGASVPSGTSPWPVSIRRKRFAYSMTCQQTIHVYHAAWMRRLVASAVFVPYSIQEDPACVQGSIRFLSPLREVHDNHAKPVSTLTSTGADENDQDTDD